MLKIIWSKEEFEEIQSKLSKHHDLIITEDPNEVPAGKVGIVIQKDALDLIKPILSQLALEKSQILLPTVSGYIQVFVHEILYLEAFGDDIYMHSESHGSHVIKQPLYQLETMLRPYHFVRIGKSFIVSMIKIRWIRTAFNAKLDLELIDGTHLEVSRSFVKDFKYAMGMTKKGE